MTEKPAEGIRPVDAAACRAAEPWPLWTHAATRTHTSGPNALCLGAGKKRADACQGCPESHTNGLSGKVPVRGQACLNNSRGSRARRPTRVALPGGGLEV